MRFTPLDSPEALGELKRQYMAQTTAPLDGMWLCGFVPMAKHFGLYEGEQLSGYFCVNDEGYLLQFFVCSEHRGQSSAVFESLVHGHAGPAGEIAGAFVSTAEPEYLSLCLDHLPRFEVNALMYQVAGRPFAPALSMTTMTATQRASAVDFAVANIGAPAEWLVGYYQNLIDRGELFGLWKGRSLIALGESRGYDEYQTDCADLGVIVAKSERGEGLATEVLRWLIARNDARGSRSICSTEATNVAAQKAITRAGFFAHNRIVRFRV